jgi:hypothetical protein
MTAIEHTDAVSSKILAVSEDRIQEFVREPFSEIARLSGVEETVVLHRIKAMLTAGTIRRVRQTLLATNLADGALWRGKCLTIGSMEHSTSCSDKIPFPVMSFFGQLIRKPPAANTSCGRQSKFHRASGLARGSIGLRGHSPMKQPIEPSLLARGRTRIRQREYHGSCSWN